MRTSPNPSRAFAFPFRLVRMVRPAAKGNLEMHDSSDSQLHRLPGLFRRWELGQVIKTGADYRIEDAGSAGDGTPLYSIYAANPKAAQTQETAR